MSAMNIVLYLVLTAFIILIAIYLIYLIGKETLRRDYEREFEQLKRWVRNYPKDHWNPYFIMHCFERIKKYKCRDKEEVSVLEAEFKNKYDIKNNIKSNYDEQLEDY